MQHSGKQAASLSTCVLSSTRPGAIRCAAAVHDMPQAPRRAPHTPAALRVCLALLLSLLTVITPQCLAQAPGGGGGPGEGALRLSAGETGPGFEYGRLEIFLGGRWGNVCDGARFTPDSAQVACRQLGYDGGARLEWLQPYPFGIFRNIVLGGTAPVLMSEVDCDGTESRLLDCQADTGAEQPCRVDIGPTSGLRGIVLGCSNAVAACDALPAAEEEGSLRLRGGFGTPCDQMYTGFVEVFHNNEWGAINARSRDNLVPDVVCRQLGFPHGTGLIPLGESSGPPRPPSPSDYDYGYINSYMEEAEEPVERVWLSGVECSGPEEKVIDCDLGRGVIEQFGSGPSFRGGRLTVACRRFAVEAALEARTTQGTEAGDLRLFNQTTVDNWVQGRLEVFFEGSWSQVCAFAFDAADGQVACRQLGFTAGTALSEFASDAASPAQRPRVFPEVAITKAGCNGSEARLIDCPVDPIPTDFLTPTNNRECYSSTGPGLYVACVADPDDGEEEGSIRLRNQQRTGGTVSGVLEIFHAGAWGTICDGGANFLEYISEAVEFGDDYYSGINPSAGNVACVELGFSGGDFEAISQSLADDNRSPPWVDALLCIGDEALLRDCPGIEFGDTAGCEATQRLVCTP